MSLFRLAAIAATLTLSLSATPVAIPDATGVFAQVLVPTGAEGNMAGWVFDIRGTAVGGVFDSPSMTPIGGIFLTSDLFGSPPVPNASFLFVNPGVTEGILVTFDFVGTSVFTLPQWDFAGTGVPLGGITDPALAGFVGPVYARFSLSGEPAAIAEGTLYSFDLNFFSGAATSEVPEPASVALAGLGLAGIILVGRHAARK